MLARDERRDLIAFVRKVLLAILLIALALAAWQIAPLLFLVFGASLLAVILRRLSNVVASNTPLKGRWALAVVVALLFALILGAGALFGQQLAEQFSQLVQRVEEAVTQVRQFLEQRNITGLLGNIEVGDRFAGRGLVSQITGAASRLVELVAAMLIVLFVGIYLAASPGLYRGGLLLLLPKPRQEQGAAVLDAVGEALWRWMLGQFLSMIIIGLLSTAALMLLGVPMAFALGLIAGLLEFIPIIGPWLAAVPAILVGFTQGPTTALWVAVAYLVIQQAESYLVAPLAQRWAVALPPVLTVTATTAFTLLFGFIGLIFATPLAVAIMVVVRSVYVRDTLSKAPSEESRMPG